MVKNQNLIPTLVVDVNGKTTTVHKKPQGAASNKSIPAPVDTSSFGLANSIADACANATHLGEMGDRARHDFRNDLRFTYSLESLQRIDSEIRKGGVAAEGIIQQLREGESEWNILGTLHFYPKLGIDDYKHAGTLVRSLNDYEYFAEQGGKCKSDENVEQQCIGVITLTHHLDALSTLPPNDIAHPLRYDYDRRNFLSMSIKDERVMNMVIERPDEAKTIAEIVAKHGNADPNFIMGVMHGFNPALAEGGL